MTDRKRDPLPEGYQFRDAGYPRTHSAGDRLYKGEILTTIDEAGKRTRVVTKGELFDTVRDTGDEAET